MAAAIHDGDNVVNGVSWFTAVVARWFTFGLGFLGLGVSWVYVSIHNYGHLNTFISVFITSLFVIYLALFTGLVGILFSRLAEKGSLLFSIWLYLFHHYAYYILLI